MKRILLLLVLFVLLIPTVTAATHTITVTLNPNSVSPHQITAIGGDKIVLDIHAADPQIVGYPQWGVKVAIDTGFYGSHVQFDSATPNPAGSTTCTSATGTFKTHYWYNKTSANAMDIDATYKVKDDTPASTFYVSTQLVVFGDKTNVLCDFTGNPPPPLPGDYNIYSGGGDELELEVTVSGDSTPPSSSSKYTCSISGQAKVVSGKTPYPVYTLSCFNEGNLMSCPEPSKVSWKSDLGFFLTGSSAVKWEFTPTKEGNGKITVTYPEGADTVKCEKSISVGSAENTCTLHSEKDGEKVKITATCYDDSKEVTCPTLVWTASSGTLATPVGATVLFDPGDTAGTPRITATSSEFSCETDVAVSTSETISAKCPGAYCFNARWDVVYFSLLIGLSLVGLWLFWEAESKWAHRIGLWKTWGILLAVALPVLGYFLCLWWLLIAPGIAVIYFASYLLYKCIDAKTGKKKK